MMVVGEHMKKLSKLNNKGFAVSVILYTSVALVVLILFIIVSILSTNNKNKTLISDSIKKDVSGIEEKDTSAILGLINVSASDNVSSGLWHMDSFTLNLSMPESSGVTINFPITYYYGTSMNSINEKAENGIIEINDNTDGTTYYVKACRTGSMGICTEVGKYIVRLDKTNPDFTASGDSTKWSDSRTLTINPDSMSGISYYEYYITDWEEIPNEEEYETFKENKKTFNQTGKYVYLRATNNLGRKSSWKKYDIYVDSTIPLVPTIISNDGKISGEWHNSVVLTVSGSTSLSGIDYYYSTTISKPSDLTTLITEKDDSYSVTFSEEIDATFSVMACNKAKVCSDVEKYVVRVDTSTPKAPTISGGSTTWTTDAKTFKVTSGASSISGVAYYEYYISLNTTTPSATQEGTKRFSGNEVSISTPGRYVFFREVNNAGASSTWTAYKDLYVDLNAVDIPTITASDGKTSGEWHTADFTLTFSNDNVTVPLTYYYGTSEASLGSTGTSKKHTANTTGTTYYVKACKTSDKSFCSEIASYEVKFDKTAPTLTVSGASKTWANSRTLTIAPTSTSGISYYEYAITDTTPTEETEGIVKVTEDSFTITDTGTFIYIRAMNKVGLGSAWTRYNLYVDNAIPISPVITANDKIESGGWHSADVTLTAKGSTALSSVSYYYSTTSTDPYDSSFTKLSKSTSGVWTVKHTANTLEQNYYITACNSTPTKVCSPVTTYVMRLDKTTLSAVTATGGNTTWGTQGVEFTVTSTNTPFSGFSHYEYFLSTSTTKPATTVSGVAFTTDTITITSPGKYVYFREVNVAGRKSAWTGYKNLFIDEPNLEAPIITAGDGIESGKWHTAATKLTFTNKVTSIPLTYYYGTAVENADSFTAGSSVTVSSSIEEVTYYVYACRSDSNKTVCSDISSYVLKIDKDTPSVSISGGSETWAVERSFTLTSKPVSGVDYYEYYISSSTTKPSSSITEGTVKFTDSNIIIKSPISGKYIYFRVTNRLGITSGWTSYKNLYVDSVAPNSPTITAGDGLLSGEWHTAATKLTFSGSTTTSTVTYKYYNSEDETLRSGSSIAADKQLLNTATNGRTYYVKACNSANLCSEEVSYLYKMDNTTPAAPGIEGGDATWSSTGKKFVITPPTSASGIDYYEYYISNSTTAPATSVEATSKFTLLELTINDPGKYIYFRAVNSLGKVGKWSSYKNLYVDNDTIDTPVITASDGILSGEWHTAAPKLTFSGSTTASTLTYYYGPDQDNLTSTGSSIANTSTLLSSNTAGSTIYVKACNTAGVCSFIAGYEYKLDNVTPKAPTVTGGEATWTTVGKEFTITSNTTATMVSGSKGFEYFVSTSTTAPSASVEATGIVTESPVIINTPGKYIYFREVTNAGKKSAWTGYKNLYVEYLEYPVPVITVSDNIESGNWHTTTNIKLTFSSSISAIPVTYYYYTNTNSTETSGTSLTDSSTTKDIIYYVRVCRSDSNKASCSEVNSYHMKIDSVAPKITLAGPSEKWSSKKTLTFTPATFSGINYYEYYLSNTTTTPTGEEETIKVLYENELTISESYKYIFIRITDIAGKTTGWTRYNLYVDSLSPSVPTITANDGMLSGEWHVKDTTLTFASESTPISEISYRYRTSVNSNYTTASSVKITTNTEATTYYVMACTGAGLCSSESSYVLRLDKSTLSAPTVTVNSESWDAGPKSYTLTHTDTEIGEYEYYISSSDTVPDYTVKATGKFTGNMVNIYESGVYIFFRAVNDLGRAGNWTTANKLYINISLLSDLTVDNFDLEPIFAPNTYLYSMTVPYDVTKLDLNPIAFNDTTKIKVSNNENLVVGINTIYIETDNNGVTATYRIEVTRLEDTTNTLKSLTVSDYELEPDFNEEVNDYTLTVGEDVSTIMIDAIPTKENETVTGIGEKTLEVGENVFPITVTAASGDINIYKITIIKN